MNCVYRFDSRALKELRNLGHPAQKLIIEYLDRRIAGKRNPRRLGKALKAELAGLWHYRAGDYRIICQIQDKEVIVLVVAVGRRRRVYK